MVNVNDYAAIVGQGIIDELFLLAQRLEGKIIQNINSTAVGGGVAEILTRMIPLLRQVGVDARWDVIKGNERFFGITKKIHNALHGVNIEISPEDLDYFLETNRDNAQEMNFYGDILFIHDSQPIALVEKKKDSEQKWVWRCHVDFTTPKQDIMNFL
ncbi:MAG: glycosyl transferase family 1, partial [bacterium]|nr:glycosyl transferase family 1 [bacterium]